MRSVVSGHSRLLRSSAANQARMDSADTDRLRWRGLTQHAKFMVELAEQGDIGSGETRQNGKQTRRHEENHVETPRVISRKS